MVREVPPPPDEDSSCVTRDETAGWRQLSAVEGTSKTRRTAYCLNYAGEHRAEMDRIL